MIHRGRQWAIAEGDCREVLAGFPSGAFSAVVTDPPYELGHGGHDWDRTGVAFDPRMWASVLRVVEPGAWLAAFGYPRAWHRLACAVEDGGWRVVDNIAWIRGKGFPRGGNLRTAHEPIILAQAPGADRQLMIDVARLPDPPALPGSANVRASSSKGSATAGARAARYHANPAVGRHPPNVAIDADIAAALGARAGYFYCPSASKRERGDENVHPTVKPLALIRWLVRLVAPAGGVVLDPFAGSGTTLLACTEESREGFGVELLREHVDIARRRLP